jgi:hypothetical protein
LHHGWLGSLKKPGYDMQRYTCVICKGEANTGLSKVHEGMFFKLCAECYEETEVIRLLNESLCKAMENPESAKSDICSQSSLGE